MKTWLEDEEQSPLPSLSSSEFTIEKKKEGEHVRADCKVRHARFAEKFGSKRK